MDVCIIEGSCKININGRRADLSVYKGKTNRELRIDTLGLVKQIRANITQYKRQEDALRGDRMGRRKQRRHEEVHHQDWQQSNNKIMFLNHDLVDFYIREAQGRALLLRTEILRRMDIAHKIPYPEFDQ